MPSFKVKDLKTRLDKFLAGRLPEFSRGRIQKCIAQGLAEVNGQAVSEAKFTVRPNDEVKFTMPAEKDLLRPVNLSLKILYNNHGLLILDKPAGLSVHPGAGVKGDSLVQGLLHEFKGIKKVGEAHRPGIVHRLDKDTSGCLLAALTAQMYEHLKDAFANHRVKKEYLALLAGHLEPVHGFIDTPIGKSKSDFRKYAIKNVIQPKEALTEYWVLEYLDPVKSPVKGGGTAKQSFNGVDGHTLVRVRLHTGRTHQIRVHFLSLGHPLMGDALYGRLGRARLPGLARQFLHASKITVQLSGGEWIEAESRLPEDLRKVLKNLGSKAVNQL